MPQILVNVFATYIGVPANKDGSVANGVGDLRPVLDNLREMDFNPRQKRWFLKNRYYAYNYDTQEFLLPVNCLADLSNTLKHQSVEVKLIRHLPVETKTIDITMNPTWKDRVEHAEPIAHLTNSILPMRACDLQTGKGKSVTLDTLIRIPRGWKKMGDIQVGDTVISVDGTETNVTGVYPQGKLIVYRVTFWDGRSVECSGDHLWEVFYVNTSVHKRWKVVNTIEMIRLISMPNPRVYVRLIESEDYSDVDLSLHPYVMGVYLGDGNSQNNSITTPDSFIIEKVKSFLPDDIRVTQTTKDQCPTYFLRNNKEVSKSNSNSIRGILREFGLQGKLSHEKFIPPVYLEGSKSQRLQLLQGLLDTDGYVEHTGTMSYCTTSLQLALDVQYLIRSLGGIASVSIKTPHYTYLGKRKEGRLAYVVNIRHTKPSEFFTLPKKADRLNDNNQYSASLKLRVACIERLDESKEMQCISVDHPSRLYVIQDFIVTHNTYCAIRAITQLTNPTLIVCDGLVDQWKKEFLEKTAINEDKIYLIKGAPSLVKLFKQKERPEVFIASIDTLRPYIAGINAPYNTIPSYQEFLKLFNIGIKVVDEFHLNFGTLVAVDLRSNVQHNLYLSATPKRSSKQEKKIFDLVFPKEIISGGGEYDKYVNITFYRYRLEFTNQNAFKTIHGYSHAKYEAYIMNTSLVRQRFVFSVLLPIVNSHYIHTRKPGQKLLIFCRTVLFCDSMKEYIAGHFPDLDVRTYTQSDPDSNLEEADVIVSTAQSCGTGRDIANLITVIQTCSMGSEPLIEQVLGRLRKPKNGDTPEFVDIYNTALSFHMGHYRKRSQIYRSRALKYTEHELV